jgi:hypothetical protein
VTGAEGAGCLLNRAAVCPDIGSTVKQNQDREVNLVSVIGSVTN